MIDTQAIRNKILDLAIRGQLTEQMPEDGTGEELYRQIRDEKDQLIKERKLKKEKSLPPINDEEVPFPIPDNWKWVRLLKIAKKITDGTHHSPVNTEAGDFMYVTAKNIKENGLDLSNITFVSEDIHQEIYSRCNPEKNDVLLIKDGATTGIVTVNNLEEPFSLLSSVALIKPLSKVLPWYVAYAMRSPWFSKYIRGEMTGVGITRVVLKQIETFLTPLPPLHEQQRIVEKIDRAFSVLDTIDALQAQYADNLTSLKAKLIDAAIQGKLTKQLPEDGTAEELYREVQAERKHQEEAGTIKAVELKPEIDESEKPFDIPSSWKWTNLGNVSYIVRGGSPRPIKQYITTREDGINWIKIGDVEKGGKYIYSTHEKIIPEGESKSRHVYPGDFLLTNSMSFGRPYISKIEGCIHDGWLLIHDLNGFDPDYLYYLLSSTYLYNQFTVKASGSTVENLNIDKVKSAIIPFPPVAEQKRIAKKIEEYQKFFQ